MHKWTEKELKKLVSDITDDAVPYERSSLSLHLQGKLLDAAELIYKFSDELDDEELGYVTRNVLASLLAEEEK